MHMQVGSDGDLYIDATTGLDPASFFSGLIDDIQIYSEAQTADEITEMVK